MKKTAKKTTKKTVKKAKTTKSNKTNLLAELTEKKMAQQKTGGKTSSFNKFKPGKQRNENNSNVGPSWGGRKGN
jgi:hypothetical protein